MSSSRNCCPPSWKIISAFLFDAISAFLVFGMLIAYFTNNLTRKGFRLKGATALLLFAVIIAYFFAMNKWLGGTLGKKMLGIATGKRRENSRTCL